LQVTGHPEIGLAAWYGPRHLGHRTASGDRLDGIHATAAHRSLPLNSLARVTNLKNGRSVVVKVTDRGPWRSNRLIDVSPKAAEELDMKRAGIVRVRIEPVVRTAPKPQLASGSAASVN
jgi:rare lipoprotein A